jgi:hypothetical protein
METDQQASNERIVQDVLEQEALRAEERRAFIECAQAEWTGIVASGIGILILYLSGLLIQQWSSEPLGILCLFSLLGIGAFPIGVVAGWLAFEVFHRTTIPVRRMAILFAIIGDLTLFGWILVFVSQRLIE